MDERHRVLFLEPAPVPSSLLEELQRDHEVGLVVRLYSTISFSPLVIGPTVKGYARDLARRLGERGRSST